MVPGFVVNAGIMKSSATRLQDKHSDFLSISVSCYLRDTDSSAVFKHFLAVS